MVQRIAIIPDQIRDVARQFKAKSQESLAMRNQLDSMVKGIQNQWYGATSQRFYTDFETWKQHMQNHVELLNTIGLELDKIANTLETTDRQLTDGGKVGKVHSNTVSGFGILLNKDGYGNWLVPAKDQKVLTVNGRQNDYGCTPTCVSMITDFWNKMNPEEYQTASAQKLLDANIISFDNGLDPALLVDDLKTIGYTAEYYPNEDLLVANKTDLLNALKEGPVIGIVKLDLKTNYLASLGVPHSVVITGISDDGTVTVSDPWGNFIHKYSWEEFDSSWGSDFGKDFSTRYFVTILPS